MKPERGHGAVLTWADRLTLYALAGLAVGLLLIPPKSPVVSGLLLEGPDGFSETLEQSEEGRYEIQGPLGSTFVVVSAGGARVESSPCPHKVCVGMGTISRPGEVIVCVPNGVVVRVLGQDDSALHATTR